MRIRELLTESVSSILYHATSFYGANTILENNILKGPEISFTRSLQGAYHKHNKLIGIIFQFDGNKLNQKYKGGPVGTEKWDNDPEDYDPNDRSTWTHTGRDNKQLEDRVYAKPGIEPVVGYITNAIVYAPIEYIQGSRYDEFDDRTYAEQIAHITSALRQLEANGIPYRFVASEKGLTNRTNDKDGFIKVLKYMYKEQSGWEPHKSNTVSPELKKEFNVGQTWILHFLDYTDYDPDWGEGAVEVTKHVTGVDRDEAIAYGRKEAQGNVELVGITDVDHDEHTDL